MTDLRTLGTAMRDAQRAYFKDRSRENLIASKQAEAAFDKALAAPAVVHGDNADLIARLRARTYAEDVEIIGGFERVEHDDADASATADAIEAAEAQIAALGGALNKIEAAPVSYSAETLRKMARAALEEK